ncbi:cobalamin-dependent protein [Patescibacteria group bacterium]|nr:cobalamin-dependent protein [Patescibacteria group bacterium]
MKITFVGIAVESLAIEFLSSYLKSKGHEVDLVFDPATFHTEVIGSEKLSAKFDIRPQLVRQIIEQKPDLIGFSVFTINYQRSLELAKLIKKYLPNTPIIFGGIHPTSVPELVIKEKSVDMVCVGEGEQALDELLASFKNGESRTDIKNIWFKQGKKVIKNPSRPLIEDLDSLPFPDKDLYYRLFPGFFDDYYTISSRGCPFACTYCANNVIRQVYKGLGKPIRRRSPQNIVNELSWAKKRYHLKQLTFVDDVFVQDIHWLKEFSRLYRRHVGLPYAMLTHPSFLNEQIAQELVKSGCYFLLFGIQSASENTRHKILNRHESNDDIRRAAKSCHDAGLKFSIDHIFNIPTEGIKEYEEALHFYNELRPTVINAYWLQYFPKAEIIQHALKAKMLKPGDVDHINRGLTNTSLVVGFGNKNDFDPALSFKNFQFFFMLLPILPKRVADWIIARRWYRSFKPPLILNISLKFFIIFINQRASVYFGIIKSIFHFISYDLKLKWKYRNYAN